MTITIDAGIEVGKGILMGNVPVIAPNPNGNHTITANGNAMISTAQVKFGTGSYTSNSLNGFISVTPYSSLAFGTGPFTIECWYYPTSSAVDVTVMGMRPPSTNGAYPAITVLAGGTPAYYVGLAFRITATAGVLVSNAWNSIAVARSGTSTKLFVNGTQSGITYTDTTNYLAGSCIFGANDFQANGTYPIKGYLDEIRISNVARYTSNYTPATVPFVPDSNTLLLLHCDGTNGSKTFLDSTNTI